MRSSAHHDRTVASYRDLIGPPRCVAQNRIICPCPPARTARFSSAPSRQGEWGSASGPASVVLRWCERRVGGLGPGLTSESADADLGCPAKRSVGRAQVFYGTHRRCRSDLPGLGRGRGSQGPAASGCVPSLQPEKRDGIDHRRDAHHHWRRGHPCGCACRRRAGSDRGLLGVQEFPVTPARYARLLDWLGGFGTVCLVGIEGTGSYGAGLARHVSAGP
jgi:hypothetical protein